ncbi:MAG: aspartate 1-decarboxylase [Armatimonadetes bacterium]|mgnify:FL=1|nr:MAG: aspartate 1-decarboxylase [Armatimonadota bacterium]MCZ7580132.1 aspartate 1-decarboxylase [Fimbriimonadaceae bacterium]MBL1151704.1 aspartate 1-decarboxylase [Armatimonadota bacterium]NOG38362.1 aspartate 1-decarboxylase [Armatimonadota bacterium]NUM39006.1 aspartate 1-decarboxylase [Armatimonadota bacterium]
MRLLQLLKAKLHHAHVTYANPEYVGSIEIDGELMKRAGLLDGELVQIWAVDRPARLSTYAFAGPRGVIGLNGGAAHFFEKGDRLVICAFAWTDEVIEPTILLLDKNNEVVREMKPYSVVG